MSQGRRTIIVQAIVGELEQQAAARKSGAPRVSGRFRLHTVAVDGEIDIGALAGAIDAALDGTLPDPVTIEEGRPPEELTAENDD